MAKPRIVSGSESKGKPKIVEEEKDWELEKEGEEEGGVVSSGFTPKKKGPGDLIMADDWNNIQFEIKDDITNIVSALNSIARQSSFLIASGVSSHDMYVELNWGFKPHVLVSYSGPLDDSSSSSGSAQSKVHIRCYPYDISAKGFRIHAQSDDGRERGIVNWIAIGVVQ
jgi:hypothetical protein